MLLPTCASSHLVRTALVHHMSTKSHWCPHDVQHLTCCAAGTELFLIVTFLCCAAILPVNLVVRSLLTSHLCILHLRPDLGVLSLLAPMQTQPKLLTCHPILSIADSFDFVQCVSQSLMRSRSDAMTCDARPLQGKEVQKHLVNTVPPNNYTYWVPPPPPPNTPPAPPSPDTTSINGPNVSPFPFPYFLVTAFLMQC